MESSAIPIEKVISHVKNDLATVKKSCSLSDFDYCRITKEKEIPQLEPTIKIAGAAIASAGNITGISAAAKAGKTAFKNVVIAGAISRDGLIDGFEDLEIVTNADGKAVIDFDTEQSEADQQTNLKSVLRRANLQETPDYYRSYNIRQLKLENYQGVTNEICELCNEAFKGVHLIVIDGGADYIASVNDEAAAYHIVQYFTHLSITYNCPVIIVVHQNPGSDKERGHFGSEIQRKCYGLLTITKEGDVSTLQPKIMRKAGIGDVPLINYKYCKEKGYHVQVGAINTDAEKDFKYRQKVKDAACSVFAPPTSLRHKEAINKIMDTTNKGLTTAKTMLGNMEGFGYIVKGNDEHYRLNMQKVNLGQNGSIDPN